MANPMMIAYGAQAAGQLIQGYNAYRNGKLAEKFSQLNARFIEIERKKALERGDQEGKKLIEQGQKFLDAQKASILAQGIELDSDIAIRLQQEAQDLLSEDADSLRERVWAEAFGYEMAATEERFAGKLKRAQGKEAFAGAVVQAGSTLAKGAAEKQYFDKMYGGGRGPGGSLSGGGYGPRSRRVA